MIVDLTLDIVGFHPELGGRRKTRDGVAEVSRPASPPEARVSMGCLEVQIGYCSCAIVPHIR